MRMKIEFNGAWGRMGLLIFALTIRLSMVIWVRHFLGKVFGKLKRHTRLLSLFGQQHGDGFWLVIILGGIVLLRLGGAVCAGVVERQWIISCYTVQWQLRFGIFSFKCLELIRWWLGVCWINWLVGGIVLVKIPQTSGILPLYVWCGLCGGRGTTVLLRILNIQWVGLLSSVYVLFFISLGLGVSQPQLLLGVLSNPWVVLIICNCFGCGMFMLYAHHVALF